MKVQTIIVLLVGVFNNEWWVEGDLSFCKVDIGYGRLVEGVYVATFASNGLDFNEIAGAKIVHGGDRAIVCTITEHDF